MTSTYSINNIIQKLNFFNINILHLYKEDNLILFLFNNKVYEFNLGKINRYTTKHFLLTNSSICK